MKYDVIIVGGSYAGMAAALQLLRARKSVLVIDAGQRRNRFASHSHGFLGQDGVAPSEIARVARQQLGAYPTLTWVDGQALAIEGAIDRFRVTTTDQTTHQGARILLATGVQDELPEINGLAERWGQSIFHCPYCHGYELEQSKIGVIATSIMSTHQAELLSQWGEVTFLTNGALVPDADARKALSARDITIDETPISHLDGPADVILTDDRTLQFAGLFIAPRTAPSITFSGSCCFETEDTPMGPQIKTDATKQTTVPGMFACGDVASMPHSVSLAVGDGAMTGMLVHRSLVWPDAVGSPLGDSDGSE